MTTELVGMIAAVVVASITIYGWLTKKFEDQKKYFDDKFETMRTYIDCYIKQHEEESRKMRHDSANRFMSIVDPLEADIIDLKQLVAKLSVIIELHEKDREKYYETWSFIANAISTGAIKFGEGR